MNIRNNMARKESHTVSEHFRIYADGTQNKIREEITLEHELYIYIQDQLALKLICTPENLLELVVGRLLTSGVINEIEDIQSLYICEEGIRARVFLNKQVELSNDMQVEQTCCTDNRTYLSVKNDKLSGDSAIYKEPAVYPDEWIFSMINAFSKDSLIHKKTKGVHSCYLGVEGNVLFSAEDIGRHNALDKAVGYALLQNILLKSCMLFTSGRVPTDMVRKVITAGVPILISKSDPTDAAVKLAAQNGLRLIGKAWPDSYDLYV